MKTLQPCMLYEALADSLREQIFRHELLPGDAIDELVLAAKFGVSRTPLREALKVLTSEGMVEMRVRHGCAVARLKREDIAELLDILDLLEGFAVRQSAQARIRLPVEADFYLNLFTSSGNHYLSSLVEKVCAKLRLAFGPRFDAAEMQPSRQLRVTLSEYCREGLADRAVSTIEEYERYRRQTGLKIFEEIEASLDRRRAVDAGEVDESQAESVNEKTRCDADQASSSAVVP